MQCRMRYYWVENFVQKIMIYQPRDFTLDSIFDFLKKNVSVCDLFLSETYLETTLFEQAASRCEYPLIIGGKKSREIDRRLRPAGGIRD